jgi:hypothetical protein
MTESILQQQCFVWHWNEYQDQRGRLYMNYNNPPNKIAGARLKSQGLMAGVADLSYLSPKGLIYIELKMPKGRQSPKQTKFEKMVTTLGYPYHIIRTFEEFQELIKKYQS